MLSKHKFAYVITVGNGVGMTDFNKLLRKIQERLDYLNNACDYDLIKAGNALTLVGMACVLFQPGNYLHTSDVLRHLERFASELQWSVVLLCAGLVELVLLIITGTPPLFGRTTRDVLRWHKISAGGFYLCIMLFGTLAFLLTPHAGGAGWGTVFCGVYTAVNLYACKRAGRSIAVDRMVVKIKSLPGLMRLDADTIDAIVLGTKREAK